MKRKSDENELGTRYAYFISMQYSTHISKIRAGFPELKFLGEGKERDFHLQRVANL